MAGKEFEAAQPGDPNLQSLDMTPVWSVPVKPNKF